MRNINETAKQEMQKALEKYKENQNSVKEFYPCTQKLTLWLQEKVK